jgi:hypothetical protein
MSMLLTHARHRGWRWAWGVASDLLIATALIWTRLLGAVNTIVQLMAVSSSGARVTRIRRMAEHLRVPASGRRVRFGTSRVPPVGYAAR